MTGPATAVLLLQPSRMQELATQPYGQVPEMPFTVHQERQLLAQLLLAQTSRPVVTQNAPVVRMSRVTRALKVARVPRAKKARRARVAKPTAIHWPCGSPACPQEALWRLVCIKHLAGLPKDLQDELRNRPIGVSGRPSLAWKAAATRAAKLLKKGARGAG